MHSHFKKHALSTFRSIQVGRASFDIGFHFNAHHLSDDKLCGVALALFDKLDLISFLNLSELEVLDFIVDVQKGYLSNPYHSFQHAVDVCVFLFYSLVELNLSQFLSKEDMLTLMISGLCHDIGHPGVNNSYQINTHTHLAKIFNNHSVLENYSIILTLDLLNQHQFLTKISSNLVSISYLETRIVDEILATDMSFHFSLQSELSELLTKWPLVSNGTIDDTARLKLCKFIIHAADISNAVRPWNLCKLWSDRVISEFFNQGDLEKFYCLPLSPNMDRDTTHQHQVALDFDALIVKPFFEILAEFIPKTRIFLFHLSNNRHQWQSIKLAHSNLGSKPIREGHVFNRRVSFSAGTVTIPSPTHQKHYYTMKHNNNLLPWVRSSRSSSFVGEGSSSDKRLSLLFPAN